MDSPRARETHRRAAPGTAAACALTIALALSACGPQSAPYHVQDACEVTRTFHVISTSWHTGIVIRRDDLLAHLPGLAADFETPSLLELGWGDAAYYRNPDAGADLALRAIAWPTSALMHVTAVHDSPSRWFPHSELIEIAACQRGYERMLRLVAASFVTDEKRSIRRKGPGLYGESYFYEATGRFHAFNTCNTWTAMAVAASGYPIANPTVVTADALMAQLRASRDAR